jgi:hypothetical protein
MTERSLDSLMASIWNMLLNLLSRYSEADVIDETLQSLSAVPFTPLVCRVVSCCVVCRVLCVMSRVRSSMAKVTRVRSV